MMPDTTTERVIRVVSEQLGVDITEICQETSMQELHADSLDITELVMDIEAEFGLGETEADLDRVLTVADLVALARRKRRAA